MLQAADVPSFERPLTQAQFIIALQKPSQQKEIQLRKSERMRDGKEYSCLLWIKEKGLEEFAFCREPLNMPAHDLHQSLKARSIGVPTIDDEAGKCMLTVR